MIISFIKYIINKRVLRCIYRIKQQVGLNNNNNNNNLLVFCFYFQNLPLYTTTITITKNVCAAILADWISLGQIRNVRDGSRTRSCVTCTSRMWHSWSAPTLCSSYALSNRKVSGVPSRDAKAPQPSSSLCRRKPVQVGIFSICSICISTLYLSPEENKGQTTCLLLAVLFLIVYLDTKSKPPLTSENKHCLQWTIFQYKKTFSKRKEILKIKDNTFI